MQLPRVIGLTGLKRSGKSTLARELAMLGYENVAFADPLRDLLYRMDPIIDNQGGRLQDAINEYGWEWSKDHITETRRLLQFVGTEIVREVNDTHWVDQMREKICDNDQRFVVSDIRFENEAEVVRECGGIVVEILRPGYVQEKDTHISEAGVEADWVIHNSGTKDELLEEFMREVLDL